MKEKDMQRDIKQMYHNEFGVAFQWKEAKKEDQHKIQLIFRDMGFLLQPDEILVFSKEVELAKHLASCEGCPHGKHCRSILLKTPSAQVDLAVSLNELMYLEDLIEGTIFQLQLNNFLDNLTRN
ncbi:hypothetical protein ACG2LH_02400 [Zhouia sp. PK063]|uniref:hypothetical protein n=1 Tax=Zhouia sp. PK063 TaxID=3373602 RepID=UPI0037B53148